MEAQRSTLSQSEIEYLKAALSRTHQERFEMGTRIYKIHQTMKKAKITHKPFINK